MADITVPDPRDERVLIGVTEAMASIVVAPSMKSLFSFALLVAVLALRPQGLMGRSAA